MATKFNKKYNALKRDRDIEANGKRMEFPDVGLALIVRAASDANPLWVKRAEAIGNETRRIMNFYKDDPDERRAQLKEFMVGVFADIMIADWDVTDGSDQPVKYTPEDGREFLRDHDDVYNEIDKQVWDTKNFRAEAVKKVVEEVKNG